MTQKMTPMTLVFILSLFLSAGLLFAVQPMAGKMLLPLVGGAPSGWVVSMAFFQIALLAGYCISYGLGRLPIWQHGTGYLILLGLGALFLPATLATNIIGQDTASSATSVLLMLGFGVGVPFVAIAASGPTLQRLYAASNQHDANDPYFLYAASNLGSFGGLLSYPFIIEPLLDLQQQSQYWTIGYAILCMMAMGCLALTIVSGDAKNQPAVKTAIQPSPHPTWQKRCYWMICAALPSSLILSTTTKITNDIISVPLIWIIPLSLYLLTFVISFSKKRQYKLDNINFIALFLILSVIISGTYPIFRHQLGEFLLNISCFFVTSLCLHSRLSDTRPDVQHLTEFYLFMSIGGAIGGALNAFAAPLIFPWYWEHQITIIISALLIAKQQTKIKENNLIIISLTLISIFIFFIRNMLIENDAVKNEMVIKTIPYLSFAITSILVFTPRYLIIALIVLIVGNDFNQSKELLDRERSFFGISRVFDSTLPDGRVKRSFIHGTTIHGAQIISPVLSNAPLTYYAPHSPADDFFTLIQPKKVALVGLGAGALLCYKAPDRHFTVIEIDQKVIDIANEWFSFTKNCGPADFLVGDGRLVLASSKQRYDMIILDAFSSDSIPIHLLNVEAMKIYLDHLEPDGVIAFHISNRFFNLTPAIAALGRINHMAGLVKLWKPPPEDIAKNLAEASIYTILSRQPERLEGLYQKGWHNLEGQPQVKPWTDNFSNILSALTVFRYPQNDKTIPSQSQTPE